MNETWIPLYEELTNTFNVSHKDTTEIIECVDGGNILMAVKLTKEYCDLGLKEAKDLIDRYRYQ